MIGIYKITNKINGNFYIGQSVDIKRRFMEHRTPNGTMTPIKLAIKKYGLENFAFEVLEECSKDKLNEREIYWISTLRPQYNKCAGGPGARNHHVSDEVKAILSKKAKEQWAAMSDEEKKQSISRLHNARPKTRIISMEQRQKLRKANLGKKQSAETIEKRKQTIIEKKKNGFVQTNQGHRKKVTCLETNQIFESVKDAAEFAGVTPSNMTRHLKGCQASCKGKHFAYVV